MAYTQLTLDRLSDQLGVLLDDQNGLYWTTQEKYYAIWEGLRVWGALTNYWRARGTFATQSTPWLNPIPWGSGTYPWLQVPAWYDLSILLPGLRSRSWTLNQLTQQIQYMCLENPGGISGTGMSQQISIQSILQAIQRARNQFVQDARFPYSIDPVFVSPAPPQGIVPFPQTSVFVHRAGWYDLYSQTWTNLWREDAWSIDKSDPDWTLKPGNPRVYSEAELSPLQLQTVPPPQNEGVMEAVSVDSLLIDIADPKATFNIPDEWIHAVLYAALQDIFSAESQNKDPLRAQYAEMRYQQAVDVSSMRARNIIRLLLNNVPLPIDSMQALDAASPFWRNQVGRPSMAGTLYDLIAFDKLVDQPYGAAVDVVRSAPLPNSGSEFIQLGAEDIPRLIDYCTHVLTFKCGGKEFQDTFAQYDAFLEAAAARGRINQAKIRYLTPLFGQPQKEQPERPDRMEKEPAHA